MYVYTIFYAKVISVALVSINAGLFPPGTQYYCIQF